MQRLQLATRRAVGLCRTAFLGGDAATLRRYPPPCDRLSTAEILRSPFSSAPHNPQNPCFQMSNVWLNGGFRCFSSVQERDEQALEEEAERKVGWLLKFIFIGTALLVAFEFFPYMGDTLLQQSISLLHVKDPLFKRMGASRLCRFAVDDERRMKVVELGGAQELLNMLEAAKDDKTRKHALKTLLALSQSDAAAEFLRQAGGIPIVAATPNSVEYAEIATYKSNLLKRFEELKSLELEAH